MLEISEYIFTKKKIKNIYNTEYTFFSPYVLHLARDSEMILWVKPGHSS